MQVERPSIFWNVPAGQGTGAEVKSLPLLKKPAGTISQYVWPPSTWYAPGTHCTQLPVPGAQLAHCLGV